MHVNAPGAFGRVFYGAAKQEPIGFSDTQVALQGYHPFSTQMTMWWVLFYLPIVPLGTYRIVKRLDQSPRFPILPTSLGMYESRDVSKGALFFADRVEWDWTQILIHYALTWGALFLAFEFV